MLGIIVSFALNVLRHSKTNCTSICGVGKNAHCVNARGHKLLGTDNSVKIMAYALKCVGNGSSVVIEELSLLQNGVGLTAGESIAGKN